MNDNPAALRECLQGDCNKILRETLHAFDAEEQQSKNVCDIDVDAVLERPLTKLNYGRVAKPKTSFVIPRTPQASGARGFIKDLLTK
tara:strand:+ start:66637 stop:66897 length:261 start_codon:yes stop_codon:yes gene_type:complete